MANRVPHASVPHVTERMPGTRLVSLVVKRPAATALVLRDILDREDFERAGAAVLGHVLHCFVTVAPGHVLAWMEQLLRFHFTPRLVRIGNSVTDEKCSTNST